MKLKSSISGWQFESEPAIKTKPATEVTVAGLANFLLGEPRVPNVEHLVSWYGSARQKVGGTWVLVGPHE